MNKNGLTVTVGILLIIYSLTNFIAGGGQFLKGGVAAGTGGVLGGSPIVLYLIALFILAVAVIDIVAAVGLFTGKEWAYRVVMLAVAGGFLVEIQDVMEDGFGFFKIIYFGINILAFVAANKAKKEGPNPAPARA